MHRSHRLHRVGSADCLGARLGETEMLDLSFSDEILGRARDFFDRNGGVDTVLI